jgi:hypothetical protein
MTVHRRLDGSRKCSADRQLEQAEAGFGFVFTLGPVGCSLDVANTVDMTKTLLFTCRYARPSTSIRQAGLSARHNGCQADVSLLLYRHRRLSPRPQVVFAPEIDAANKAHLSDRLSFCLLVIGVLLSGRSRYGRAFTCCGRCCWKSMPIPNRMSCERTARDRNDQERGLAAPAKNSLSA